MIGTIALKLYIYIYPYIDFIDLKFYESINSRLIFLQTTVAVPIYLTASPGHRSEYIC